mgnify:CR=1 FL=1
MTFAGHMSILTAYIAALDYGMSKLILWMYE